jgi:hypothetical protein
MDGKAVFNAETLRNDKKTRRLGVCGVLIFSSIRSSEFALGVIFQEFSRKDAKNAKKSPGISSGFIFLR